MKTFDINGKNLSRNTSSDIEDQVTDTSIIMSAVELYFTDWKYID